MTFHNVATIAGYKSHITTDGKRTLCGREVSNGTSGEDMCKRCATAADKLRAARERLEYAARVSEAQDDVMSQSTTPDRVPTDVLVTDATGHRYAYATVPNGDPVRIALFVATAEGAGTFTDVTAVPTPTISTVHYGESFPLCGSLGKSGTGCTATTDLHSVTCRECSAAAYRPVDAPAEQPATVTKLAVNGHMMDYETYGYESDGRPHLVQWNATHSVTCPCLTREEL